MSLLLKPHTVVVSAPQQDVTGSGLSVGLLEHAESGVSVSCKIQPLDAVTAFEKYAVETKQPHKLMCEISDAGAFVVNALVVWDGGFSFRVRAKQEHRAYASTAHCVVILEAEDLV